MALVVESARGHWFEGAVAAPVEMSVGGRGEQGHHGSGGRAGSRAQASEDGTNGRHGVQSPFRPGSVVGAGRSIGAGGTCSALDQGRHRPVRWPDHILDTVHESCKDDSGPIQEVRHASPTGEACADATKRSQTATVCGG